ncbi:nucleotidyltransferase family protein [Rhodohalobacter barkolensis]|uniref:Nucleotidyltransferase n=1 Tax=Rhodohalobacter barkolensis TaxID=2053187 RepID=A0A2N0VGC5_9BACT|nr:nucleotidyltransferase family protein [Rhodohalobacter barkolensis]PKD43234.1 nucleotidyltransferase [Rhodohalobacter barkolensis]
MKNFETNLINKDSSLEDAIRLLNHISDNLPNQPLTLLVVNSDNRLFGTLTDGDIRRTLLAGTAMKDSVSSFMNKDYTFIKKNGLNHYNVKKYVEEGIQLIPMLNDKNQIVKVYDLSEIKSILPIEAVIMAGGEGTRLRPLTYDTPKPMLHVGDKPILERNMNRLISYGIENLTISIRYLGEQITSYFGNGEQKDVNIRYIREENPLGTAGSLSLIDSFHAETILLTNSDILTTLDYEEFYLDFVNRGADISIVTIPYRVKVPYGVFEMNGDHIAALKEKPEYTYYSNAGIYLIKRELINQIPKNQPLDITDFIEQQISNGKKVTSFPFWGYWLDIGKHEDFENAQKAIQILDSY